MSTRYVITSRSGDRPLPEGDGIRFVAALDRGVLVDVDEKQVARLEEAGWRFKALRNAQTIQLFSYEIDTATGTVPPVPPELESPAEADGEPSGVNHLLQLAGPVQESWLAVLSERGIRIVEPVGPYAYFIRADAGSVDALNALPFVEWTGPLEPAYKVNPVLLTGATEEDADRGLGAIEALDIGVLADGDVDGVATLIGERGGEVQDIGRETTDAYRSITAQLPTEAIPVIAAHADVRWVDAVRAPLPEDERTAQIVFEDLDGTPAPNTGPNGGYPANLIALGVDGTGVAVAICDTGVDTNDPMTVHADLAGRLAFAVNADDTAVAVADTNGHGTHVAGIAGGDGGSGDTDPQGFVLGQGMAPGADIGSVISNGTRQQRIETSAQHGADVMNNSYALDGDVYSAGDRTFDLGVRDADPGAGGQTPLVIVFSAGNSGPGNGTLTKATKNALVVGNSLNFRPGEGDVDDIRGLRSSSSRGPTDDGRMLPQIVAPGTNVVSARSGASPQPTYTDTGGTNHADHTMMSGTSMAAPHVAGMAALVIDWWRQTRNGHTPSPALVKALLVASAEPVAGGPDGDGGTLPAGPNDDSGWGRVSIENSLLQAPDSDRGPKIFVDQRHAFTATGQEYTIRIAAVDAARPLRISLAWTDAAAAVGVNPTLVNDLDLEVRHVDSGDLFRGNVFSGGFSTTGGAADDLNNIEVVAIQNPTGVYEVTVVAANVTASARTDIATPWQDFGLVIDNAEVPAADPVSVVTVLDRSGSMQTFGYVDITRQASRQFIDLMQIDDAVGVVSFGASGDEEYPGSGSPEVITGQGTRDAATAAVDGIGFGGCTFMGAGIERAGAMLGGAGSRRAMVLLSDGYDNKGCDEGNPAKPWAIDAAGALPADLPIYTCAMGPASDQNLLAQLADDTDGRYYFMPTIDDLFEIYNYIRGQVTGDGVIVNESSMASVSHVSGWVDGCAQQALFTVAWHDPALRYVPREPKGPGEIAVRLRSPGGRWLPRSATEFVRHAGEGYVSFTIQDPQPGLWRVEVATDRRQHTPYTVGGFVRSAIGLKVDAPVAVGVGDPIDLTAVVSDPRGPLPGVKVKASVFAPVAPISDFVDKYRDRLSRIKLPSALRADGGLDEARAQVAQLVLLRDRLKAKTGEDLLAPVVSVVVMGPATVKGAALRDSRALRFGAARRFAGVAGESETMVGGGAPGGVVVGPGAGSTGATGSATTGTIAVNPGSGVLIDPRLVQRPRREGVTVGRFGRTQVPGSYTFGIKATGFSPACGTRFVRCDMVSVVVLEK